MNRDKNLSVIIIARNEATRIGEAINSVLKLQAQIIVVDQSSTDETGKVAESAGAMVINTQEESFARLREIGKEAAKGDWIFYIDADERITEGLANELGKIIETKLKANSPVAYFVKRENYYLGKKWPVGDKMERLFWKSALSGWKGELHESPIIAGDTGTLENSLIHITHRSLEEMVEKTNKWSEVEARLRRRVNHPRVVGWRLIRVMLTGFFRSYIREGGWRMGTVGMIESIYQAFSMFITYAKLWEKQQ